LGWLDGWLDGWLWVGLLAGWLDKSKPSMQMSGQTPLARITVIKVIAGLTGQELFSW